MQGQTPGDGEVSRNSSAGGEGQVLELLGRAQVCHSTEPGSHQHLLEQEQQWLLAQSGPRPQGQAEVRTGLWTSFGRGSSGKPDLMAPL